MQLFHTVTSKKKSQGLHRKQREKWQCVVGEMAMCGGTNRLTRKSFRTETVRDSSSLFKSQGGEQYLHGVKAECKEMSQ